MQLNLVVLLALFQFYIPSTLYAEEFCSSLANSTLLVPQNIDGDFRTSDSSIVPDSFSMNQSDFEISGVFKSPDSPTCQFNYSGELYGISFDDGSTVMVGTDNGGANSSLQLFRVLEDVNDGSYQLIFFNEAEDEYCQADGQLDQSID